MTGVRLEPNSGAYTANILVKDFISFRSSGVQDIWLLLHTNPAVPAAHADVVINGTMSDDERSDLLRRMYAMYRDGPVATRARS